ncbi:MAG: NAD(+)/NADH kinase [Planctomycetes bacterium]|nr:NAD(+)/NADH kinase [Planctomycetota bacterium]
MDGSRVDGARLAGPSGMPDRIETIEIAAMPESPEACRAAGELARILEGAGFRIAGPEGVPDLVVVLGGDGFLLQAIAARGYGSIPFFGFNFGHVGFLMNRRDALPRLPALLRERRFTALAFPVLEADVDLRGGGETRWLAVNDLVVDRLGPQTAHLEIHIDGVLLNRFAGDGLIISTAAGSTAYSLAAGGPVLHPAVRGIVVTPLYPHRPVQFHSLQFPVILPLEARIRVQGIDTERRPLRLLADGKAVDAIERVSISFAGRMVPLLRAESFHFIDALVRKIIGLPNHEDVP